MKNERTVTTPQRRKLILLLTLSVAALLFFSQAAAAQSGRRQSRPAPTTPQQQPPTSAEPSPEPSPVAMPTPKPAPAATIIVGGDRLGTSNYMLSSYIDEVLTSCMDRLKDSKGLEIIGGGHMTRNEAVTRAKKEQEAYVLWLDITVENDAESTIAINYFVFQPQTGKNFTNGNVYLGTRSVGTGGVGVGIPTVSRRLPIQTQMREGGRQVADRVTAKFHL